MQYDLHARWLRVRIHSTGAWLMTRRWSRHIYLAQSFGLGGDVHIALKFLSDILPAMYRHIVAAFSTSFPLAQ